MTLIQLDRIRDKTKEKDIQECIRGGSTQIKNIKNFKSFTCFIRLKMIIFIKH